jgi:anaerobic selenocysteine-containing dehydrogenase
MGLDLLEGAHPDDLTDELFLRQTLQRSDTVDVDALFAAGPHGVEIPVEHGWVHDTILPDGRWRLADDRMLDRLRSHGEPHGGLVLTPRREMGWNNSVHYGGPDRGPLVRLHPDDAQRAGIDAGDTVVVTERPRLGDRRRRPR